MFLALQCREAFYGGAAGPGKTTAMMMAALQYADVPGYRALILRRTFSELDMAGGLIELSQQMLGDTDARYNQGKHRWTFPSGATLTFGYLQNENDKLRYQGGAYHFIGWDELTHFSETQYTYLFSRQRRPKASALLPAAADGTTAGTIPIRMRSASNPGGPGHSWVKTRFVNPKTRKRGRMFVKALMTDNPHLDIAEYMIALAELKGAERLRLAAGDWDAKDAGEHFNRGTWLPVDAWGRGTRRVRAWDFAATVPTPQNPDPDWTVGLRMSIADSDGQFCVDKVLRGRWTSGEIEKIVRGTAKADGYDTAIIINQDPGSAGKAVLERYQRHILRGYTVIPNRETGDKVVRAKPVSAAAEISLISYVLDGWNEEFFEELESFPNGHDDQVDPLAAAHRYLSDTMDGDISSPDEQAGLPDDGDEDDSVASPDQTNYAIARY